MAAHSEIIEVIAEAHGREVFTVGELLAILQMNGCNAAEAGHIVKTAINNYYIGRVSFRKIKRNMPSRNSLLVLSVNNRK